MDITKGVVAVLFVRFAEDVAVCFDSLVFPFCGSVANTVINYVQTWKEVSEILSFETDVFRARALGTSSPSLVTQRVFAEVMTILPRL